MLFSIAFCFVGFFAISDCQNSTGIQLSATNNGASDPIPEAFVSYSIEFAFFPDFAGTPETPNSLSYNLLSSIANLTGSLPVIRVGGNTQDYALYNPNLQAATNGTYTSRSADYPTILYIGKAFFDSYNTWPGVKFIHGFNLGKNGSTGFDSLIATVPLACSALSNDNLAYWELGNEPDLYKPNVRPADWDEAAYVSEWLNKTRAMNGPLIEACPSLADRYNFVAPSLAGVTNSLDPVTTWQDGLNTDQNVDQISIHNYIGGANQPGVTLQGTLMNHSSTVASANKFLNVSNLLAPYDVPFILGETNSLYQEGRPGLSNAFGAALWGIDFNLYCAANNVKRVHMHQGTAYRYGAWNPVPTNTTTKGTKAPFYGSIFVASMLRDLTTSNVSISEIALPSVYEAAYAAYVDGRLSRVAIINMVEYNYTADAITSRPSANYSLSIPEGCGDITVQRLYSNGSDAITGITFDGYSYNWELDDGRPVLLSNVTRGEALDISESGQATVGLPYSSAVILNLEC